MSRSLIWTRRRHLDTADVADPDLATIWTRPADDLDIWTRAPLTALISGHVQIAHLDTAPPSGHVQVTDLDIVDFDQPDVAMIWTRRCSRVHSHLRI